MPLVGRWKIGFPLHLAKGVGIERGIHPRVGVGFPTAKKPCISDSDPPEARRNLMIVGIFDGIIKKFNDKFPRQAVKKFDKISAVNGKAGTSNEMRRTGSLLLL
jgi:hypothetical protein